MISQAKISDDAYNADMSTEFENMKAYIGFDEKDVAHVRALDLELRPAVPDIVNGFYDAITRHDDLISFFQGGATQLARQKTLLTNWLYELLSGPFDEPYYHKRRQIGETHVRVGLEQRHMLMGIELIWQGVIRNMTSDASSATRAQLTSLHKLLMLDLSITLESYKDHYTARVQKHAKASMEEKLTRAEHLAEIGQLAASLAHEIKNPLAGISGAIQIIREGMDQDNEHRPIITEILGQIHRLDATVKDLLQYARPVPPQLQTMRMREIVERVLTILRAEPAVKRVSIRYEPPSEHVILQADEAKIEQLLINLILNAAHASKENGVVDVKTSSTNGNATLCICDAGEGMSQEAQDNAFEAFFTTKARGTGLGLPICRRIVESHGGTISLESQLGAGTVVTVILPVTADDKLTS